MKQKRGITLVALVITIIVLLILAGVSINFIFGAEGIFTKSQYAAEKYKQTQEEENVLLSNYNTIIDAYSGSKISAEDVSFSPSNPSWNVKNVKEALDYLYNN